MPAWLAALAGDTPFAGVPCGAAQSVEIAESAEIAILRTSAPVRDLDDAALRAAVCDLYAAIARVLEARALSPWRFWNYLPQIGKPATIGANRYQVFNAGRCDALRNGFGEAFPAQAPAASAVGHAGASLVVDLLAGRAPGVAVENPRQTSPMRYSQRWGPLPPYFSRATLLPTPLPGDDERCALISGTASIVGEDTQHAGELAPQIGETIANLASLAHELGGARFRELRIYVAREKDAGAVAAAFTAAYPQLERLEVAAADLCRAELLLEAEGVATLGRSR
jgi:chorismate lyase/3-hydroxybenzoate synthase